MYLNQDSLICPRGISPENIPHEELHLTTMIHPTGFANIRFMSVYGMDHGAPIQQQQYDDGQCLRGR